MSVPFEQSPALTELTSVRHGFFGRRGGSSTGVFASLNMSERSGDDPHLVASNRAQALAQLDLLPEALAIVKQVHSASVATLSAPPDNDTRPDADAMVTNRRGLVLGILTADCTPILLADQTAGVVGAAHAGWKGAVAGIIPRTIAAMVALGADPIRMVAAIGPTISMANYEVGPEFTANLLAHHRDAANRITRPTGGREHFDLPGFVFDQLHDAGVGLVNDLGICTYGNPKRYFSHRYATHQGSATGRQLALIGLA